MSKGREHRSCISRCESRCVLGAASPFTKGHSVPGKLPRCCTTCVLVLSLPGQAFLLGILIVVLDHLWWRTYTVLWSPLSSWDLKFIDSREVYTVPHRYALGLNKWAALKTQICWKWIALIYKEWEKHEKCIFSFPAEKMKEAFVFRL